jgi:hypothetical protein
MTDAIRGFRLSVLTAVKEGDGQAMVLYTIYPHEVVFQVDEQRDFLTVEVDSRVFVIELVNGQAQIVRLISHDPRDYLNPNWQPGTKLNFSIPVQ